MLLQGTEEISRRRPEQARACQAWGSQTCACLRPPALAFPDGTHPYRGGCSRRQWWWWRLGVAARLECLRGEVVPGPRLWPRPPRQRVRPREADAELLPASAAAARCNTKR